MLKKIILGSGLAAVFAFAAACSNNSATDHMAPMSGDEHQKMQTK